MEVFGLGIRIQEEGSAAVEAAIKRLRAELVTTASVANSLGAKIGGLTGQTNGLATSFRAAGTTSVQSAGLMESSLRKVGAQFAASYLGVQAFMNGIRMLVNTSDTMLLLEGRINLVANGVDNLRELQDKLFVSSQLTRTTLASTAELFARVARNSDQLGMSQQQLLNFTELTQMSIRTSGINAIEASRGMIQFSQALASGVLRGDEFRAVMEQMPGLARSIADGLGVPIGALREMANNGELTAEKVIAAITKMEGKIRSDFSKLPTTIGDGMTRISNSFAKGIADFNDMTGAAESIGLAFTSAAGVLDKAFSLINSNITTIKATVIALGGVMLAAFSGNIITALTTLGSRIVAVQMANYAAATAAGVNSAALATLAGAAVTATTAFTALWTAIGGPLGIAIAAAVGAFAYLNKQLDDTNAIYDEIDRREDEATRKRIEAIKKEKAERDAAAERRKQLTKEQLAEQQKILEKALEVNALRLDRIRSEREGGRFGAMSPFPDVLRSMSARMTDFMGRDWFTQAVPMPTFDTMFGKLIDVDKAKSEIDLKLGDLGKFIADNAKFHTDIAAENMQATFADGIGGAIQNGLEQGMTAAIMSGKISNLWKGMAQSLVAGLARVMVEFAIKSKVFGTMMESINKLLMLGNGLGAVAVAAALLAYGYANGGKATMGATTMAGGAGGMSYGVSSGSALPVQQIIFGQTSATTAAGMTPRQSMNVTVIGPNDPSAQRAIQELMTKADSRGRLG